MASKTPQPKKGKGAGKKARYLAYKTSNTKTKNKLLRTARHKKRHPNDTQEVGIVPNYKPTKLREMHYKVDGKIYVFRNRWVEYKKENSQC